MTATHTSTCSKEIAEKIVADLGGWMDGRKVSVNETGIEVYGATRDGARLADMVAAATRVTKTADAADTATAKQIDYLATLIARDPGEASNFGLTAANVRTMNLTKNRASELIGMLR